MADRKANKHTNKKGFSSRNQGRYKKKVTAFPKGQQSNEKVGQKEKECTLPRPTVRHSVEYFSDLIKETHSNELSVPGPDGKEGRAMLLRPVKGQSHDDDSVPETDNTGEYEVTSDNILVHKENLMTLINSSMVKHAIYDALQPEGMKCTKTKATAQLFFSVSCIVCLHSRVLRRHFCRHCCLQRAGAGNPEPALCKKICLGKLF